jgi:hypothetical protein
MLQLPSASSDPRIRIQQHEFSRSTQNNGESVDDVIIVIIRSNKITTFLSAQIPVITAIIGNDNDETLNAHGPQPCSS